jgi:hypothetical protein
VPPYPDSPQADKALVGNPAGTAWTFASIAHHLAAVTALTGGGATTLDGLATADILAGRVVLVVISGEAQLWQLLAGTTAESVSGGIVRPDDYSGTNEKIWSRIS